MSNRRRRFCEVWRATDTVLARPVTVKLLHAGYAHQPEARARARARARFKAEARRAGALSHQNIARVYDYGEPPCGQSCQRCAVISDCVVFSPDMTGPVRLHRAREWTRATRVDTPAAACVSTVK